MMAGSGWDHAARPAAARRPALPQRAPAALTAAAVRGVIGAASSPSATSVSVSGDVAAAAAMSASTPSPPPRPLPSAEPPPACSSALRRASAT